MKKELNKVYFIKDNETIDEIAKKYNTNPIKILIKNNTTPTKLKENNILFIE